MPRNPSNKQVARHRPYSKSLTSTGAQAAASAGKALGRIIAKQITKRKPAQNKTPKRYDNKFEKVIEGHGDITYSKYKADIKPSSALTRKLASTRGKLTRRYINTYHLSGQQGRQFAFTVQYFETAHLKDMTQDVWNTLASNELGGGGTNFGPGNLEPFISKTNHCLTLTSFINSSQTITVYDLLCKRDTDEYPSLAWKNGLVSQGDTSADAINIPVGVSPYQSKNFRDKWKIEKVTKMQLRPGETHKHYIDVNPNKAVLNTRLQGESGTVKANLAGITRSVMVVLEGSLGRGTSSGQVTTVQSSVGCMWQRHYIFSANQRQVVKTQPLPTASDLPTTLGDVKIIQPDGDITAAALVV